jgi:hypothetical protein
VTSTELFEEIESKPTKPVALATVAPLLITKLLLLPEKPTERFSEFVHLDPVPVTSTLLPDEVNRSPIEPAVFATVAPLLITKLLLLPA